MWDNLIILNFNLVTNDASMINAVASLVEVQ